MFVHFYNSDDTNKSYVVYVWCTRYDHYIRKGKVVLLTYTVYPV